MNVGDGGLCVSNMIHETMKKNCSDTFTINEIKYMFL